jgi:hypothetical protein
MLTCKPRPPQFEIDDYFWLRIHSKLAVKYVRTNRDKDANEARIQVLEIVKRMLNSQYFRGIKKELLYYKGVMHYFLENKKQAIANLKQALKLHITEEGLPGHWYEVKKRYKLYDEYLSEQIKRDFSRILKNEKKIEFLII